PENERLKSASSKRSSDSPINTINTINSFKGREIGREEEKEGDLEYRNWLINRANLLPQKPALMEQWVEKEMLKAANKREFAQYEAQAAITQTTVAMAPIPEDITPQDYWAAVEARRNNG
ncbi:hypothetical protein AB3R30_21730, partial [Leptolyngbyaceae cyanobacterium UHCC 1019]